MATLFTRAHRGGSGPPLVCLHGFMDTWRSWELVLPALERHHDVLAPTLAGHAGGPAITGPVTATTLVEAVEHAMDAAGMERAHVAGSSLGGHVALQLAERDRALSVVALAPAGGWALDDDAPRELFAMQRTLPAMQRAAVASLDGLLATAEGRRRATALIAEHGEEIPAALIAHILTGIAACPAAERMLAFAATADWTLDPERIRCPVRIIWGADDRLLPWPQAAARYRDAWLPHADWVLLDGVGHSPQLDAPLETAQLILGLTAP